MLLRSVVVAVAALWLLVSCGGGDDAAPEPQTQTSVKDNGRAQRKSLPAGTPVNADAHIKGQFGPVKSWPVIPTHVALTADGRVLGYGSTTAGQQTANFNYAVWDPAADTYLTLTNSTGTDIFCSSQLLLPAGDRSSSPVATTGRAAAPTTSATTTRICSTRRRIRCLGRTT